MIQSLAKKRKKKIKEKIKSTISFSPKDLANQYEVLYSYIDDLNFLSKTFLLTKKNSSQRVENLILDQNLDIVNSIIEKKIQEDNYIIGILLCNLYYLEIENLIFYFENFQNKKLDNSPVEYRQTLLIPRSIPRTIERFFDELQLTAEDRYLSEFKISRQQIWTSFRSLGLFIFFPLFFTQLVKSTIITPVIAYSWNTYSSDFFINYQQEERALKDLQNFEDILYFEQLVRVFDGSEELLGHSNFPEDNISFYQEIANPILVPVTKNSIANLGDKDIESLSTSVDYLKKNKIIGEEILFDRTKNPCKSILESQMLRIANRYNQESIELICNLIGDLTTLIVLLILVTTFQKEVLILKAFVSEILYSLSDTTKSFFIILLTDLLVGFHSPKGWEILIQFLLNHFALPQNEDFVFLCVATFPVLLDTAFKYWIFRYLNRLSPSTVVTYHNMIE